MACAAGCAGCGPERSCFHGPELTIVPAVITTLLIRIMTAELEEYIWCFHRWCNFSWYGDASQTPSAILFITLHFLLSFFFSSKYTFDSGLKQLTHSWTDKFPQAIKFRVQTLLVSYKWHFFWGREETQWKRNYFKNNNKKNLNFLEEKIFKTQITALGTIWSLHQ